MIAEVVAQAQMARGFGRREVQKDVCCSSCDEISSFHCKMQLGGSSRGVNTIRTRAVVLEQDASARDAIPRAGEAEQQTKMKVRGYLKGVVIKASSQVSADGRPRVPPAPISPAQACASN